MTMSLNQRETLPYYIFTVGYLLSYSFYTALNSVLSSNLLNNYRYEVYSNPL